MSAIVLIGAQWGDEGKGKATDLLGGRVQWVVRYQGGNNAGHTVVLPDGRELRAAPDPVGHPDAGRHQRHRQRCRRRSRCAARRAGRPRRARRRHRAAADLRRRAPDHAVPRGHRQGHRALPGHKKIGTTGRGIGPCYQDKIARIGVRVADVLDPAILAQKVEAALEIKNQMLVKIYNRKALEPDAGRRRRCWSRPRASSTASPTPGCCSTRRSSAARPSCWRARRARCSTSTTAPTRTSRRRTRRRAAPPSAPASARPASPRCSGILKAYTTRVGSGPFPTELFDEMRRVPVQDRRRGRRDHRAAPALRLVRRRHRPLRHPGQRHHRLLPDQARRAVQPGDGADLRRLRRSTASAPTRCR